MQELILSEQQILDICETLGKQLTERLRNEEKVPLFLCVMKGAMHFYCDLVKNVDCLIEEDYVQLSSYAGTSRAHEVVIAKDIEPSALEGRTVVIVEDVVDTGYSMDFLLRHLKERGNPKQILLVALLDKKPARKVEVHVDYAGIVMKEAKFLIGYGLDYYGTERNIPYVYVPSEEEIAEKDAVLKPLIEK
ncbi:MAG: hypoxanthine phosphoribosyltransferase [Bacilli bacterium]|nr:hypoxanthine phosphoribosyltransferase [Bacilli bacterium]